MRNRAARAFDSAEFLRPLPQPAGRLPAHRRRRAACSMEKARDLKKRVVVFPEDPRQPAHRPMVTRWRGRGDGDALGSGRCCWRNNLIRNWAPRNIPVSRRQATLPDDHRHATCRSRFYRGTLDKKNQFFGPFPNHGRCAIDQILQRCSACAPARHGVRQPLAPLSCCTRSERCSAPAWTGSVKSGRTDARDRRAPPVQPLAGGAGRTADRR